MKNRLKPNFEALKKAKISFFCFLWVSPVTGNDVGFDDAVKKIVLPLIRKEVPPWVPLSIVVLAFSSLLLAAVAVHLFRSINKLKKIALENITLPKPPLPIKEETIIIEIVNKLSIITKQFENLQSSMREIKNQLEDADSLARTVEWKTENTSYPSSLLIEDAAPKPFVDPGPEVSGLSKHVPSDDTHIASKGKSFIVFAQIPDLENGFSRRVLSKSQNGEQVYELAISGNHATFSVSADQSAQIYALSDYRYFLEPGCVITNQPFKDCRIFTTEKGKVNQEGQNWIIQSKAKIAFR